MNGLVPTLSILLDYPLTINEILNSTVVLEMLKMHRGEYNEKVMMLQNRLLKLDAVNISK